MLCAQVNVTDCVMIVILPLNDTNLWVCIVPVNDDELL